MGIGGPASALADAFCWPCRVAMVHEEAKTYIDVRHTDGSTYTITVDIVKCPKCGHFVAIPGYVTAINSTDRMKYIFHTKKA